MANCKFCLEKFAPKYKTTERVCYSEDCMIKNAIYVVRKRNESNKKQHKKDWNREKIELKESLMTLSDHKKKLQTEINSIIREIDKGHACIATNSLNGKANAGHYFSIGSNPTLRFHLENIWLQSEHSNSWKSGDTIKYQQGIVNLYGKDYLEHMNSLQQIKPLKLSISDIENKIPIARSILKWLKLQDRKFTTQERLELRKKYNLEIGIYT